MKKFFLYFLLVLLLVGGYLYYLHKKEVHEVLQKANETKNTVVAKTNADIDGIVKGAVKSVGPVSQVYYLKNHNYGLSPSQNMCKDTVTTGSIGSIIATIEKYSKKVSCVVDQDFPSRSFTLVVASSINKTDYYCTDQSGFFVINTIAPDSTFKEGRRCK